MAAERAMLEPAQPNARDGSAADAAGRPVARLDDVMLAMDVVDTLRHREDWISRELDEASREADLKDRLRTIYAGQGIQVSDEVLAQGIRALNERRFVYTPPPAGLARSLALLWVQRDRYLKGLLALLLLLVLAGGLYYQTAIHPVRQIGSALVTAHSEAVAVSAGDAGRQRANRLLAQGESALENGDREAAEDTVQELQGLRMDLAREYTLRIVSTAFVVPPTALHERIHYLVVEAVAPDGAVLPMRIRNGDEGPFEEVARWGAQVSRETYLAVDQDLRSDGRIDDGDLGVKARGEPDVRFSKPVLGGTITRW
jgi:hypothetical protein